MGKKLIVSGITVLCFLCMGGTVYATHQPGPNKSWEHGFMISDDGTQSCYGRVSPTYYHVIGSGNWFYYEIDLTTIVPSPAYIGLIFFGGDGWDFEGYWDNVSFTIDGVEQLASGDFDNFGTWSVSKSGRGTLLAETINIGGAYGNVFHYRRTNSYADGGGIWAYQEIGACVKNATELIVSGEVYLINQSLPNPGWWCCVYGCAPSHGEYPGSITISYSTECPCPTIEEACEEIGAAVDEACPCAGPQEGVAWKNHGEYVSCVAHTVEQELENYIDCFTEEELAEISSCVVSERARSDCGKSRKPGKDKP